MILVADNVICCGCGACENACPNQAIKLQENKNGFKSPKVYTDKCIECGICEKVCPLKKQANENKEQKVYAVSNYDKKVLKQSTSGGAFAALAKWIFDKNGLVYGCARNEKMRPAHIEINSMDDLYRLQGSKYVQSEIGNIYKTVKMQLLKGRYVLFSGTPCQCAALRSFLGKKYEKLFCVELICHGVPSDKMFGEFVSYLEKKLRGKIIDIRFRDKKLGWGALLKVTYKKSNRKEKVVYFKPEECYYYYYYFYKGLFFREYCYSCKYACEQRESDFTIGDYWGVQRFHPEFETSEGVSVLIVSGQKALDVMDELDKYMYTIESSLENVMVENGQIIKPSYKDSDYEILLERYNSMGTKKFASWYCNTHKKSVALGKIKRIIPVQLKRIIRTVTMEKS